MVNDGDVAKTNTCFDLVFVITTVSGLYPHFMGTFKYIEPGLFILHYYEEKKIKFYDNKGKQNV